MTIDEPVVSTSSKFSPQISVAGSIRRELNINRTMQFSATPFVHGKASGNLLHSSTSLSLWGGVDIASGCVVDHHHPLRDQWVKGCILAIPSGRGSCTGSAVLLELLLNGNAPSALIFSHAELIITLGVLVARALFNTHIPVVVLSEQDFTELGKYKFVSIAGNIVTAANEPFLLEPSIIEAPLITGTVTMSKRDKEMLLGLHGPAVQVAMEILIEVAQIQGVDSLLDITQAHIDCCIYVGPACLLFAQKLLTLGAKFIVPTTLNSISLDYRRWKELGVTEEVGQPAKDLADAFMSMGAKMSFTCAPYLLESAPKEGEQIGWGESNAVCFANSILGAKTQKYPDFLDVCIALTGRAPLSGCHLDENRRPNLVMTVPKLTQIDDSAYPLIGYLVGQYSRSLIPLVCGLESTNPSVADLKAFCAAFATTSSAPLVHINGITPESAKFSTLMTDSKHVTVTIEELAMCYRQLNTARDTSVGLVSLGNPHFAIEEFADLAHLCSGRRKHSQVKLAVTTSRAIQEQAERAGYLSVLYDFGAEIITDTCWCMLDEPIIPLDARNLMTNSGKYAHYAPGLVKRGVHFGNLKQCIDAACTGEFDGAPPLWLSDVS